MAGAIKRRSPDPAGDPRDVVFELFAAAGDSVHLSSLLCRVSSLPWTEWDSRCPRVQFLARTFYFANRLPLVVIQEYLRNPLLRRAIFTGNAPVPDDTFFSVDEELVEAAAAGHLNLVEEAYQRGARNTRDGSFPTTTALHAAAKWGSPEMVRFILRQGEHPNARDATNKCRTALHVAVQEGNPVVVELLLDHGADMHCEDDDGCTPLCYAEHTSDPTHNVVACLRGPDEVRARVVRETNTPLSPVAASLLNRGAAVDAQDIHGCTILHRAALNGAYVVVRDLAHRGADVLLRCNRGYDALGLALMANHAETVVELLDQRANIASRHETPGFTDHDLAPAKLPVPEHSLVPGGNIRCLSEEWRGHRAECVQLVLEHERARVMTCAEAVERAATNAWPLAPRLLRLSLFSLPGHSRLEVREWAVHVMGDSSACYAAFFAGTGLLADGDSPRLRHLVGKQGSHSIFRPIRIRLLPLLVASSRTRTTARALLWELRTASSTMLYAYDDDDDDGL